MTAMRQADILLLSKEASGERFWKYTVISPELGGCICLMSRSVGGKGREVKIVADLFDSATVHVRKPSGSEALYFIEDYELRTRRSGLGKDYKTLQAAAFWAGFLVRNLASIPEDGGTAVFKHAERALDLLEQQYPADWVLFKAVYLMLKLEGYPVRESWWRELPPQDQAAASYWLSQKIVLLPVDKSNGLGPIFSSLQDWMTANTELRLR
jgi:hypothetical protein